VVLKIRRFGRVDLDLALRFGVDLDLFSGPVIGTCSRLWECGVVLAGVKARPWRVAFGQP
jgi:hypothetical protein